ncbi:hypothetical protein [Burkholderia cepacia]|uniref:hypothetical protein n=1 Tax=Burkholderia cepacia TaxID=292 RepID=UPI00158F1BE2
MTITQPSQRTVTCSTGSSPAKLCRTIRPPMKGPSYTTKQGKMPVRDATEAGQLLDSVDVRMPIGLRDRALIALMVFLFTQICAALTM